MMIRKLGLFAVAVLCLGGFVGAQEPAEKLPDTTLMYGRLDTPELLQTMQAAMNYVDPEASAKIVDETKALWDQLIKEIEKDAQKENYQMPRFFSEVPNAKMYMVALLNDEPRAVKKTVKTPKVDEETGELSATEFEEKVIEELKTVTASGLLSVSKEAAEELLQLIEKNPSKNVSSASVDFPYGKVLKLTMSEGAMFYVCSIADYLVVSTDAPLELGKALSEGVASPLSALDAYKVYAAGEAGFYCNPAATYAELGKGINREAAAIQQQMAGSDMSDPSDAQKFMAIQISQQVYQTVTGLFGLDKMTSAGAKCEYNISDGIRADMVMGMHFSEEPTLAMKAMLSGGRAFKIPAGLHQPEAMCFMGRMGLGPVLAELPKHLPAQLAMQYQAVVGQIQMMLQMTPDQIGNAFGGDLYLYFDQKEISLPFMQDGQTIMMPSLSVALGISNPEQVAALYGMAMMSLQMQSPNSVVADSINGVPVYCFGAMQPGQKPDGTLSYALCNAGEYLVLGSWQTIENVLNGKGEAGAAITGIIDANPKANMLGIVPKAFQQKNIANTRKQYDQALKTMTEALEKAIEKDPKSEQILRKVQSWMEAVLKASMMLQEKALPMMPDAQVITGQLDGNDYIVRCIQELKK